MYLDVGCYGNLNLHEIKQPIKQSSTLKHALVHSAITNHKFNAEPKNKWSPFEVELTVERTSIQTFFLS